MLRNNVSQHSIGSTPHNNGTYYVRRDVDTLSEGVPRCVRDFVHAFAGGAYSCFGPVIFPSATFQITKFVGYG